MKGKRGNGNGKRKRRTSFGESMVFSVLINSLFRQLFKIVRQLSSSSFLSINKSQFWFPRIFSVFFLRIPPGKLCNFLFLFLFSDFFSLSSPSFLFLSFFLSFFAGTSLSSKEGHFQRARRALYERETQNHLLHNMAWFLLASLKPIPIAMPKKSEGEFP